jgi:hypothetical protein
MSNRQVEFVLKMRDEASAKWDGFKSKVSGGVSALKGVLGSFGGLLAGIGIAEFIQKSITASNESEQATSRLAGALKSAGIYSEQLLKQMQDLGGQYQATTRFEDDAVTSAQALLVAYTGLAGSALEPLVKNSADLAIAKNIEIEQAAELIGKSIQTGAAMKGVAFEYGAAATPMERAAVIQKILNERFGQFTNEDGKNAATTIAQVGNAWGDFLETSGDSLKEIVVALSPIINWTLSALQGLVDFIMVGFYEIVNLVTSVGGHIAWIMEKVGLESKSKVDWYKQAAQDAANKSAEFLKKGYQAWGADSEEAGAKISAVGELATKKLGKAGTAAEVVAEKLGFAAMKARGMSFISAEQESRFEKMVEQAERLKNFLAQSPSTRADMIQENFRANDPTKKPLATVQGPDIIGAESFARLDEWEQRFVDAMDVGKNASETLWSSFDSGISSMVDQLFQGTLQMEEFFHKMALQVMADIGAIILKSFILKTVLGFATGGLSSFLGIGEDSGINDKLLGKRSFAGAGASGGGSMNVTIQAMDAGSFQSFLAKTSNRAAVVSSIRDAIGKGKMK